MIVDGQKRTWEIPGALLRRFQEPCVYVWWRGNQCLYVGQSAQGLVRPLSPGHHRLGLNVQDGDRIEVWSLPRDPSTPNLDTARATEDKLIRKLRPTLNGARRAPIRPTDRPDPLPTDVTLRQE